MTGIDYRLLLDGFADAVIAADEGNRIIHVNRAAEQMLGWARDELIGQSLETIMPPRMRQAHQEGFRRFLTTRVPHIMGRPVRVPALRKDGSELEVDLTLSSFPTPDGRTLFLGAMRDLRDRVQLERQLAVGKYLRAATVAATRLTERLERSAVAHRAVTTFVSDFEPWVKGATMPVAWKKVYGKGRVFYSALGHQPEVYAVPEAFTMLKRGILWASRSKYEPTPDLVSPVYPAR